jgi:hypothetical protein
MEGDMINLERKVISLLLLSKRAAVGVRGSRILRDDVGSIIPLSHPERAIWRK